MNKYTLPIAIALATTAPTVLGGGFIEDSSVTVGLKNFYFDNDNRESQSDISNAAYSGQHREWGQAFLLNYSSGFTQGTVGFGLDAQGTLGIRLDGGGRTGKSGSTRTPGQLFPLDSDGHAVDDFSRLGLTAKAKVAKTELRHGTLTPRLPVLVSNDGRLLPQTFQGTQITSNDLDGLSLIGGLIEQATGRASTDRTGLAIAGGTQESNHLWFAGADWKPLQGLLAQYYYSKLEDYYSQHFLGLTQDFKLSDTQNLRLDLRYFNTGSEGANSSARGRAEGYRVNGYSKKGLGEIDNQTWSAALTYTHGGHSLLLGYQSVSDDSAFVQANQGSLAGNKGAGGSSVYLLTDRQITNFTRAGEKTTFAEYSYNFASLGVPGLRASLAYLNGDHIKVVNGPDQSEWERDLRIDYTLQSGPLKDLTFSWRNASLRSDAVSNTDQNRFIITYNLALL